MKIPSDIPTRLKAQQRQEEYENNCLNLGAAVFAISVVAIGILLNKSL